MELSNQRAFLDSLASGLACPPSSPSPFYSLRCSDFITNGGARLLSLYGNSIITMLRHVYPEQQWEPWRFRKISQKLVTDQETVEMTVKAIEEKICATHDGKALLQVDDWFRLSKRQIREMGFATIIERNGGLKQVLERVRPELFEENYSNWKKNRDYEEE